MASRYQLLSKGTFDFKLVQVPKSVPNDGEVLVKTKAIALNPLDWKQALLGLFISSWPTVLGNEGAGIVDSVGNGVTKFKPGDEVFGRFNNGDERQGSYQEYAIGPEATLIHKASSISFEDAASLPIGFLTALGAIHGGLGIPISTVVPGTSNSGKSPKSILVLGGSSSVGASAVQILRKLDPSTTILTTCSEPHHESIKKLGANFAFSPKSASIVSDLRSATQNGVGVEAILDAVGGITVQPELLDVLDTSGPKQVTEVPTGRNFKQVHGQDKLQGLQHSEAGLANLMSAQGGPNAYKALGSLVEKGEWQLPVKAEIAGQGLESLKGALLKLKEGVSGKKLIVTV